MRWVLLLGRASLAGWAAAVWTSGVRWSSASGTGPATGEVDQLALIGILVAGATCLGGWWWADSLTVGNRRLAGGRCAVAWLTPAIATAVLVVAPVHLRPINSVDVWPAVAGTAFAFVLWRPYSLNRYLLRSASRKSNDVLIGIAYVFDLIGFGSLWWYLSSWSPPGPTETELAGSSAILAIPGMAALALNASMWVGITRAMRPRTDRPVDVIHRDTERHAGVVDPDGAEVWEAMGQYLGRRLSANEGESLHHGRGDDRRSHVSARQYGERAATADAGATDQASTPEFRAETQTTHEPSHARNDRPRGSETEKEVPDDAEVPSSENDDQGEQDESAPLHTADPAVGISESGGRRERSADGLDGVEDPDTSSESPPTNGESSTPPRVPATGRRSPAGTAAARQADLSRSLVGWANRLGAAGSSSHLESPLTELSSPLAKSAVPGPETALAQGSDGQNPRRAEHDMTAKRSLTDPLGAFGDRTSRRDGGATRCTNRLEDSDAAGIERPVDQSHEAAAPEDEEDVD